LLICLLLKFTALFIVPALCYLLLFSFRNEAAHQRRYSLVALLLPLTAFLLIVQPYFFKVANILVSRSGTVFASPAVSTQIIQNFWLFLNWVKVYYPYIVLSFIAFIILLFSKKRFPGHELMVALLIWFVTATLLTVGLDRFFYPRHLLILLVPLGVIPIFISLRYRIEVAVLLTFVMILWPFGLFKDLVFDQSFTKARVAKEDRFQYFEDYTSGINLDAIAGYISEKAAVNKEQTITLWLDGSWVMEYGLRRALKNVENIEYQSFIDFSAQPPGAVGNVTRDRNKLSYIVINKNWPLNKADLKLEKEFNWGGYHPEYLYVFK
jgi:hypothetical protein